MANVNKEHTLFEHITSFSGGVSQRTRNTLEKAGINTIEQLVDADEMIKYRDTSGVGCAALAEIYIAILPLFHDKLAENAIAETQRWRNFNIEWDKKHPVKINDVVREDAKRFREILKIVKRKRPE